MAVASATYLLFADQSGVRINFLGCKLLLRKFLESAREDPVQANQSESVFIGVPSHWEARIVVEEAGFAGLED